MRRKIMLSVAVVAGAVSMGAVPLVGALSNPEATIAERPAAAVSRLKDLPLRTLAQQVALFRFYKTAAYADALNAQAAAAAVRRSGGGGGGGRCVEQAVNYGADNGSYSIPSEIVMRESGGNYGSCNEGSGACGAYQVMPSTWGGYGGYGSACDAPPSVQDQWAAEAYAQSGTQPWGG
jgi:hypothetical protein